jgi:enamine deaminase RidA (YjgF/YER057c/UK114 family)
MSKRQSIEVPGLTHTMPIPNACRIGGFLASGSIFGTDPATGKIPAGIEAQSSLLFQNIRRIMEAAGGTTENVLKISLYVRDKGMREHLNKEWLAMFPDAHSRPARHTFQTSDMAEGTLVSCDIMAVFS